MASINGLFAKKELNHNQWLEFTSFSKLHSNDKSFSSTRKSTAGVNQAVVIHPIKDEQNWTTCISL